MGRKIDWAWADKALESAVAAVSSAPVRRKSRRLGMDWLLRYLKMI
jgi:hypothetical protein